MPKKRQTFTVVGGTEEWEGLYVDGKLVMQDHSLRAHRLLEWLAENGYLRLESEEVKQDLLNNRGHLPDTLAELHAWTTSNEDSP